MAHTTSSPVKNINILSVQKRMQCLWHSACFLVSLNGEVQVQMDGRATYLNNNGLMLVEPDTPVDIQGRGSNLLMIIHLDYEFFMENRPDQPGVFICNSAEDGSRDYKLLRHMLGHLALNYYENIDYKELRQKELCYSLMYYLNTSYFISDNALLSGTEGSELRCRQIISFIEKNYMQDIRLEDLAKSTYWSASYLSRTFKKLTGTNFKTYLEDVRLRHAVENMRSTDKTITEIAYNNGFPNVNALRTALHKKYGLLPSELRKTFSPDDSSQAEGPECNDVNYDSVKESLMTLAGPDAPKSLGIYRFPDKMEYIVEDVSQVQPIQPIWNQIINIGSLCNLLMVNKRGALVLAQEEIGFKYARIEGILTEDSIPKLPNGQYNFSQFDRAIKLLLSLKLIPFLDLSFKGSYVHLSRSEMFFREDQHNRLLSLEYEKKVSALIRHCINTFGSSEVERWGVEISIQHDETLHILETPEEFASRFREIYTMIKHWLPKMLVGGPEFNLILDHSFLSRVLARLLDWGVRPDFLSLCALPYEASPSDDSPIPIFSFNENCIRDRVQQIFDMLNSTHLPSAGRIPIWVTVLGQDIRTRNHVNDSCHQATFLVKNTIDLIGLVDAIGYWQLSDLDSEYIDTTRILFGGTGIISKDGLKKPGFSALKRLSRLNTLMVKNEGNMLITTNAIDTYNIALYNYTHFTELYCLTVGEGVTHENAYTVFADAATKEISITLNKLANGRYRVITTTLNRENGSLFDEWLRYGIIDGLQPHDINYFEDTVHPQRIVRYHDCKDGSLKLSMQMLPHEVKFLLILREL